LDVGTDRSTPLNVEISVELVENVKIVRVSGNPARVSRGRPEVSFDDGAFIGVLLQRAGRTVYECRKEQKIVSPGDLVIWHGAHSLRFDMPEYFEKLCLLVPFDTFERVLPEAKSYAGVHLQRSLNVSRLIGTCVSTLADEVLTNPAESPGAAVELTLDLLGSALTRRRESSDMAPRTKLFERIRSFIEGRLTDSELSPMMIAQAHYISVRYLHLVFSERGTTVGSWIRSRRLAQCRAELAKSTSDRSVTEIAMRWGFSDIAHFSRSFRSAYGVSPLQFRLAGRKSEKPNQLGKCRYGPQRTEAI
jgi:AraC-like DNA-binding protein